MEKYRLSKPQMNIWNMDLTNPNSPLTNICGELIIEEQEFDYELLNKAVNHVIRMNDGLRIKLTETADGVQQYFEEYKESNIEFLDFSMKTDKEIELFRKNKATSKLPDGELIEFKLIQYGTKKASVFLLANHIVIDAYSVALLSELILNNYEKLKNNEELDFETGSSYKVLLEREQKYFESSNYQEDKIFFDNEFKEEPKVVSVTHKQTDNISAARIDKLLTQEETQKLKDFCVKNEIFEAVFFDTLIFTYLNRISGEEEITIGSPVMNRKGPKERKTLGMFVSTNHLKVDIEKEDSFRTLSKKVSSKKFAMFKRQAYPFMDLQNDLYEKFGYSGKLFDVAVSYQNAKITGAKENSNSHADWYFSESLNNSFMLSIDDRSDSNELRLSFDYQTSILSKDDVNNIIDRLGSMMDQIIENPDIKLTEIEILSEKDKEIYNNYNNSPYQEIDKSVIEIFEEEVEKNPNNIALEFENKSFTYKQLNMLANELANYLLTQNLSENEIIPIVGNRSHYTIISLLALRKINKAYFIIDETQYPLERINYLLDEVKADKILTFGTSYKKENVEAIDIRNSKENATSEWYNNLNIPTHAEDSFAAIHTSGSTGNPKVAVVSDSGIVNMAKNNDYLLDTSDTSISLITMSFDAFLVDTFLPLLNGKKLLLTNNEEINDINAIENMLDKENSVYLTLTPTKLKMLLSMSENESWNKVNNMVLGGEKIDASLLSLIEEKCGDLNLYNLYGPTETTVFNSMKKVENGETTIGHPTKNFKNYIKDKNNNILPPNVLGEIHVSGTGVAKGYYGREELTNEKFYVDDNTNLRTYKTGDFGYINEKNEMVFIGRMDSQIKINGLRIEIEEIESVLNKFPGIKLSAVDVQKTKEEGFLVAFYEGTPDSSVEGDFAKLLQKHLEIYLPAYMVPQSFVKLDSIPKTTSGKIDRKKLPKISISDILKDNYTAPETILERKICNIWEEILKVAPIGVENTFSSLGGNSKLLINMILKIERELSVSCKTSELPKNPTIKDIAQLIEKEKNFNDINIESYNIDSISIGEKQSDKDILLTGAGGYLGSHMLKNIMDTTDKNVYCLVRNPEKFIKTLNFYFDDCNEFSNRVFIVNGDISKENLGLNEYEYSELAKRVSVVINSAANVSHFSTLDEAKRDNVDGVYNTAKFALENGSKYEQMSTITISGIGVSNQKIENFEFKENNLDIGQDYSHDNYMLSKFKSEELLHKFREKGLDANIYRLGYVNNRSYDNKFQINDDTSAFKMIVDTIREFGIVPESAVNVKIQHGPVDKLAEAIVTLIKDKDSNHTYHMYDERIEDFFSYLDSRGVDYKIINDEEFRKVAEEKLKDSLSLEHSIAYKYLENFLKNPTQNTISNRQTQEKLKELGFDYSKGYQNGVSI